MKFQVPQFVEVEDKLFWILTLRQFIYLAGGGGIALIILLVLPFPRLVNIVIALPFIAFALALAFYKINNRPFIYFVEAATMYFISDKLYIWRKVEEPITPEKKEPEDAAASFMPKLNNSKLKDLTWSLDAKAATTQTPKITAPEKTQPKA